MIKRVVKHALVFFFAAFLTVYFYVQVKNIFIDAIETEYATPTTIDETAELKCYIVRDEKIVDYQTGGTYNYVVYEGEKLAIGQPIADVYSTLSEYRVQEQIRDINNKISVLEDSSVENNYFTMNINKIDASVNDILVNYKSEIASDDLSLATQRKNELLTTLNKRYLVVNALTGFDDVITIYEDKKESLTAQASGNQETIKSPYSGYFFSSVDGYETILNFEVLDNTTVKEFLELFENGPLKISSNVVGKIVSGFEWYTVCVADNEIAHSFNSGEYYNISYPYSIGTTISTKLLTKISDADAPYTLLVFMSDKNLNDFNFMREQVVEIRINNYSGLKVKKEALRIVNEKEGVYVLEGNTVKFKRVSKIYENDGYYVVSTEDVEKSDIPYIEMYDAVINNGKELYDGKVIG